MSNGISLALDGSTYAGSVAVLRDREIVAARALENVAKPGRSGRAEQFLPMVADCLQESRLEVADLDRVICGAGPGSFTSLRVAASIAKGIAVGAGIPLFAVSSLLLAVAAHVEDPGAWMAVLPAMRGEVYAAAFTVDGEGVAERNAQLIIKETSIESEAARIGARVLEFTGVSPQLPHARGAARVFHMIVSGDPVDVDTWEPRYGRLAEAQVRWEAAHGRTLTVGG